jgi:tetraacyldisaccharide-1-P 4'-kinase
MLHRGAFLAVLAHSNHARLLLNHHVETGARGDIAALVRDDIGQLEALPSGLMRDAEIKRVQARVAYLSGDRARAIQLIRATLAIADMNLLRQELAQDQYALGLMLGSEAGAQPIRDARQALAECGITDPGANMRAYVPELLLQAANA